MPDPGPTLSFRLANAVLGVAEAVAPSTGLDADALEDAASHATGLADFGDPYYREGLERLAASANVDACLNPYGRLLLRRVVGEALQNRLRFVREQRANPALFATPLRPPLIVLGLPRTGTTFLHRLLAVDPAHRAVPYWELVGAVPRGPDDTPARRRRRAQEHLRPRRWFTPELDAVHYIRVDTPEECMFMLSLTFESLVYWVLAPAYGYLDWYQARDRRKKYREYALLLRALQAAAPERLVLKAPAHTDALDALLDAVPEAVLVQTHREMVATASSWCSTNYATQAVATAAPDLERAVRANVGLLERVLERNLAARERVPGRVVDVRYRDLVADPIATVERIYAHAGWKVSEPLRDALRAYVERNPQGKHGRHRYGPERFGLDPAELRARFLAYEDRFLAE